MKRAVEPSTDKKAVKGSRMVWRAGKILAFAMIALFMLMPLFWIFSSSLRLPRDSFKLPPSFFPTSFNISNYKEVFQLIPLKSYLVNSVIVTVTATAVQCAISSSAAYAFARLKFRGNHGFLLMILSGMMIPVQATVVPLYILFSKIGLVNTRISIILPLLISPLGIFIIKQYMQSIPKSYDEAAIIDGASQFQVFTKVILPMAKPSVVVVAMLTFVTSWNDFFRPLIFITSSEKMTLPIGMTVLNSLSRQSSISVILAGVVISSLPLILVFLKGQKYLIQGISMSGVKG